MVEVFSNGTSLISLPRVFHDTFSDASGICGHGVILNAGRYFHLEWPNGARNLDTSVKELITIAIAFALWGLGCTGKHVCFH